MVTLAPGLTVPIDRPSFITSTWVTDVSFFHTMLPVVACTGLGLNAPLPAELTMLTVTEGVVLGAGVLGAGVLGAGVDVEGEVGAEYEPPPPHPIAHNAVTHKIIARMSMTICSLLDRWSRPFLMVFPFGCSDDARGHKAKPMPRRSSRNYLFFEEILKKTLQRLTRAVSCYCTRKGRGIASDFVIGTCTSPGSS
jgi:hypothetical protein